MAGHVTILMATRDAGPALDGQLRSFLDQTHRAWSLWVGDDGSSDDTRARIEAFRDRVGPSRQVRLLEGPRRGAAANFLSLLTHPDLPPGIVALSDQDDVWLPDKLARAVRALGEDAGEEGRAVLYGAQSLHVDDDLRVTGVSRTAGAVPGFGNALVQNLVSGHSAVLSPAALALVRRAGDPGAVPFHDWWLYQLVSGAGGRVVIDEARVLLYRQHRGNLMGAHDGPRAGLWRAGMVLGTGYRDWMRANMAALRRVSGYLTPEALALLDGVEATRARFGPSRARALHALGLRRHGLAGEAGLMMAALLGRV